MNDFYSILNATGITLSLAICSLLLGLLLALLFAAWESVHIKIISLLGTIIVATLRGLPEILVVLFVYFGSAELMLLLTDGITIDISFYHLSLFTLHLQLEAGVIDISPFLCGVLALSLLYAAYASQTLRGAIKAIPQGQWESGQALGLTKLTVFRRLIMPQMWRHALPGLGNQWLVLLKDTALVSLISVNDLMMQSKNIGIRTEKPFSWLLIAALIYLIITLISQAILKRIELRTTRFERGTNS